MGSKVVFGMKKFFQVDGLIWVLLGIALCIGSIKLQLGTFHVPGPGFLPLLTGASLGIFGLVLMVSKVLAGERGEEHRQKGAGWVRWSWRRSCTPMLTGMILLAYIALLEPLGFLLTTFVCLLLLFKLSEPNRWLMPLLLSSITSVVSYLLFSIWLQCQFPKGVLKFW